MQKRGEFIRDIEETIFVLVLFVDAAHDRSCRREDLVHEDEDSLLRRKLDTLADHIDKLADCKVCGHQILLLVDGRDVRFLNFFTDNLVESRESVDGMSGERLGLNDTQPRERLSKAGWTEDKRYTYRNTISVLLANTLSFSFALLEGVLVLELGSHGGDR